MRPASLRILPALAAAKGFFMRRWDFVAAYLQGALEPGEVNYCSCPPGAEEFDDEGEPIIYRVNKPVYGMAQAGRRWQRSLFPFLLSLGFSQFGSDSCLFRREALIDGVLQPVFVGVYVDDLAVVYSHEGPGSLYSIFSEALIARWQVEDEGPISDLLNVEFDTSVPGSITIHQSAFISTLVDAHGTPSGARLDALDTVMPYTKDLALHVSDAVAAKDDPESKVTPDELRAYQSIVGAMLYCSTNTRPDISFAINMLCRCMSCPSHSLIADAQRVLRYLERTDLLGLTYSYSPEAITGFSDAAYNNGSSAIGWNFQFSKAAISWGSKKQKTVSRSQLDASIMSSSEAAKEALYLTKLINELGFPSDSAMKLFISDPAVLDHVYAPDHEKSRHTMRRHGWLRELEDSNDLTFPIVSSTQNLAQFLSGNVKQKSFIKLRDSIMNVGSRAFTGHEERGGVATT
jgi:hypothetical protein